MNIIATLWGSAAALAKGFIASIPNVIAALLILLLFLGIAAFVDDITRRLSSHLGSSLQMLIGRMAYIATLIIGIVLTLGLFGLSVGQMVASLGVTGVVIGFAFKDLLQNFIAGVMLLWRQPFMLGDRIKSGSYEGVVHEINFRSTILVMDEGSFAYIPNANLFTDVVVNLTPHANGSRKQVAEGSRAS